LGSTRVVGCLKNRGSHVCVVFIQATAIIPSAHPLDDVGRERLLASQSAYEAKVETMMVSQSTQEGTKSRHERDVLAAAQLVELENSYKAKRAAEWNLILRTDWRRSF
jgi:hypothetical protein